MWGNKKFDLIFTFFPENDIVVDVGVLCNSEDITLTLTVTTDTFNGMIYPKGLSKNSTCMTEYIQQEVGFSSSHWSRLRSSSSDWSTTCPPQSGITITKLVLLLALMSRRPAGRGRECRSGRQFEIKYFLANNCKIFSITFIQIFSQGLVRYTLPLRSCNTMSTDVIDGVEYFNTVVVQPHRKLVTNQGRGYHVRCRYQTQEKLLQNDFNVR